MFTTIKDQENTGNIPSRRSQLRKAKAWRKKAAPSHCTIYSLRDPMTGALIYVGQTRSSIQERLRNHLKEVQRGLGKSLSPVHTRIAQCLPRLPVIETVDANGIWDVSEAVWIDRLRRDGHPLLNVLSVVADPRS